MSSLARERIMTRLRTAVGRENPAPQPACMPIATLSLEEKIERLKGCMEAIKSEVHVVDRKKWIDELKALLRKRKLKSLLYAPDTWVGKAVAEGWQDGAADLPERVAFTSPVEDCKEAVFQVDAAITTTVGAIAETGALILWPDKKEPRTMSLVPPIHIAVLESKNIFNSFCEVIQKHNWPKQMPTNALLISGPSKTADIEMTLAFGVHGPKELIVLILGGED